MCEESYNISMCQDTRRLETYIKAAQGDAHMVSCRAVAVPTQSVAAEVNILLTQALDLLRKFDNRCVHEHYHGKSPHEEVQTPAS